jgi:secondary thiamine-phosphate synthase enzyme
MSGGIDMKIINDTIDIFTTKSDQFKDITSDIQKVIEGASINNGFVTLFVPHTTAAVTINENTDPHVKMDMTFGLSQAFPKDKEYLHFEGNSHAHIKSSVIGNTQMVLIEDGSLKLGQWQAIYFCEFDGPRKRQLNIQMMGE